MSFDNLPDHLILDIFRKVRAKDLPRVRLVCRKWAEVVSDSIVLRRKHRLFVKNAKLNDQHPFVQTFGNSPYTFFPNNYFYNVVFEESETVTKLWSKIGADIECLRIELLPVENSNRKNKINQHNWITFLKHTPNLIKLKFTNFLEESDVAVFSEFDEVISEFNLEKLKKVTLCCCDHFLNVWIINILSKSPNVLTTIEFKGNQEIDYDTLYYLIESQRHSLKELILGGTIKKEQLQKYFSIDNLSLEVLHNGMFNSLDRDLLRLLGNHNLRELMCSTSSSENLHQYSTYLPNLKKFDINIDLGEQQTNYPFPKNFNKLKSLEVQSRAYKQAPITFEAPTSCPTLEVLELDDYNWIQISSASVQSFIDHFSNLKVLKLLTYCSDCRIIDVIADKLVHLEELELRLLVTDPVFDRNAFRNISNLNKLRHLKITDYIHICDDKFFVEHLRLPALTSLSLDLLYFMYDANEDVTDRGISALIDNCPLIVELCLDKLDGVTEACLDEMVARLPHLRHLYIYGRSLTREKVKEVHDILQN